MAILVSHEGYKKLFKSLNDGLEVLRKQYIKLGDLDMTCFADEDIGLGSVRDKIVACTAEIERRIDRICDAIELIEDKQIEVDEGFVLAVDDQVMATIGYNLIEYRLI